MRAGARDHCAGEPPVRRRARGRRHRRLGADRIRQRRRLLVAPSRRDADARTQRAPAGNAAPRFAGVPAASGPACARQGPARGQALLQRDGARSVRAGTPAARTGRGHAADLGHRHQRVL
ncbi:hypothetical protein G6F65_021873 [Rhizopus arrhizus]|nr:hypothetical protein G6F65_021873 [Rhizopus arrhizus]